MNLFLPFHNVGADIVDILEQLDVFLDEEGFSFRIPLLELPYDSVAIFNIPILVLAQS